MVQLLKYTGYDKGSPDDINKCYVDCSISDNFKDCLDGDNTDIKGNNTNNHFNFTSSNGHLNCHNSDNFDSVAKVTFW